VARYDRIAPLESPAREQAFGAWLVLRDLDGRERDPDLGRRAYLRFLALRPARRLLDQGFESPDQRSLEQQIDVVLRKLNALPPEDAERVRLAAYLKLVRRRSPADLSLATLAVGEVVESAGHVFAAEEFYHTGLEIAEAHQLRDVQARALAALQALSRAREATAGA
jgi:hypothetical protein